MAAPTPTDRGVPTGAHMDDGFTTFITIEINPLIGFWEKTVTPPGIDGGDAIETSTMHNTEWETKAPRQLKTLTEFTTTAAYTPELYADILFCINQNTVLTVTFPNDETLAFWGFVKAFEPQDHEEGTQPEATITFVPTNTDDDGVEQAPVWTAAA